VVTAGNTTALIPFTPPTTGGATITLYTAISSPGGIQVSGIASPLNCTGLTNGTLYTFTMTATNVLGVSPVSSPSNAVTPSGAATDSPWSTPVVGTSCAVRRRSLPNLMYSEPFTASVERMDHALRIHAG